MNRFKTLGAVLAIGLLGTPLVHAHLSVSGNRTLNGGSPIDGLTVSNNGRTVSSSFGWADATDDNWGDSHRLTAFRFVLASTQNVSITVSRNALGSGPTGTLLPAFSLYSIKSVSNNGTGFISSTHDTGPATTAWLTATFGNSTVGESFVDSVISNGVWDIGESFTDANGNGVYDSAGIGGSGKEGAFRALSTWEIYHDSVGGARMHFDTYLGNAADGTAANFGAALGINGDGLADGTVSRTFVDLTAGDYYILVGGGNYTAQLNEAATFPTYGIDLSVSAIPEPSALGLAVLGAGAALWVRQRRRKH